MTGAVQGMMMAKARRVQLVDPATLSDLSATPTNSRVDFRVDSDGQIYFREGVSGSFVAQYVWMLTGANTDYQVMIDSISGDSPTGSSLDTWLDTNADVTWGHVVIVENAVSSTSRVQIRDKTTLEVLASMTLNMSAEEG